MSKQQQTVEERLRQVRGLIADRTLGAMADLLMLLARRNDEQPVTIQLTWHRADLDPVKTLSRSLGASEITNPSADQGPHIEVAWCCVYLARKTHQLVRVCPPMTDSGTWDLVAFVTAPGDGHIGAARRTVFRGVQKELKFMVARNEYGCARVVEKG